jgi:hypothetical protein
MLIVGSVLSALSASPPRRRAAVAAAAAGLCIAAFSKPPLFAIAAAGLVVAALAWKRARAALIASLVLGAVLMCLLLAPPEIAQLVRRIIGSQHVLAMPNTPLALPAKVVRDWVAVPLPLSGAAGAMALSFALRRFGWSEWLGYAAIALSLYYLAKIVPDAIDGEIPDFLGLAVATTAASYAAVVQRERHAGALALGLLFAAPVGVALGTFNNQWFQLNFSMAFPFLAMFALAAADSSHWRRGVAQAFAIAGPVAVMLLAAWAPYSLPAPIFEQQIAIQPPLARGPVLVDEETANFVNSANGLARGALLVDLSGTGPGVAAVLGGRAPVLPWLNPATPAWVDVVWSRLSPEQRESAWFVVPVWPQFVNSAAARWLAAHKSRFCSTDLPEMPFWDEERTLELLRPCGAKAPQTPSATPA